MKFLIWHLQHSDGCRSGAIRALCEAQHASHSPADTCANLLLRDMRGTSTNVTQTSARTESTRKRTSLACATFLLLFLREAHGRTCTSGAHHLPENASGHAAKRHGADAVLQAEVERADVAITQQIGVLAHRPHCVSARVTRKEVSFGESPFNANCQRPRTEHSAQVNRILKKAELSLRYDWGKLTYTHRV